MSKQCDDNERPARERPPVLDYAAPERGAGARAIASAVLGALAAGMIVLVELVPRSWAPASGLIGPPTAGLALIAVILSLPGPRRLSAAGRRLALVGAVLGCAILLAFTVSLSLRFTRRGDLIMPAIRYVFYTAEKVEAFKSDCGRYPTTAEGLGALVIAPANVTGWKGPYRTSIAPDSWGHAFIYVCPGTHNPTSFDLYSAGPDGKPGTADDIGNWKRP